MLRRECSLCGGKLRGDICTECGLDNSKNDDNYKTSATHSDYEQLTHVHESYNPFAGKTMTKEQKHEMKSRISARNNKTSKTTKSSYHYSGDFVKAGKKKGFSPMLVVIIPIICALIGVFGAIGALIENEFSGYAEVEPEYEYNYDPYEFVEYELEDTGESFEEVLSAGFYVGGVHLPEGCYDVTLVDGAGTITLTSEEHSIYIYESVVEEQYDEIVIDDLRIYEGAKLGISDSATVILQTENAKLPMEVESNPNTESFKASEEFMVGEDVDPGVYDVFCAQGSGYFDITIPVDEELVYEGMYIGEEGNEFEYPALFKNVVLPENATVYIYGMTVELVPSGFIKNEEYVDYYR